MITEQLMTDVELTIKTIKRYVHELDSLHLGIDTVETMIGLRGHMTRVVEELLHSLSKDHGLNMKAEVGGYRWTLMPTPIVIHQTTIQYVEHKPHTTSVEPPPYNPQPDLVYSFMSTAVDLLTRLFDRTPPSQPTRINPSLKKINEVV